MCGENPPRVVVSAHENSIGVKNWAFPAPIVTDFLSHMAFQIFAGVSEANSHLDGYGGMTVW